MAACKNQIDETMWPSDPKAYEWKGTLYQFNNQTKVLAYCKLKKRDIQIEILTFDNDGSEQEGFNTMTEQLKNLINIKNEHLLTPIFSFVYQNEIWILYPRYSGGLLSELLASYYPNGITDEHVVCHLVHGVVSGIANLHKFQTCHRNIRPSSIWFDKDSGIALLSEFRQLKEIKFKQQKKRKNTMISACREPWTDPVLFLPDNSGASWYLGDIYSIGITALHLAFGEPPMSMLADDNINLVQAIVAGNDVSMVLKPFYEKIGVQCYEDRPCPFSNSFEQFVNDCTKPTNSRISINKLLQHNWFKKNLQSNSTSIVRSKIGHLFQSIELRINNAINLAPKSFQTLTEQKINEKIETDMRRISNTTTDLPINIDKVDNVDDVEWNFKTTPSSTGTTTKSLLESMDLSLSPQVKFRSRENKGRFVVESTENNKEECEAKEDDPIDWTATQCGEWVEQFGDAYKPYKQIFIENGIDAAFLKELVSTDSELLKEIISSKLHFVKIVTSAKKLFNIP